MTGFDLEREAMDEDEYQELFTDEMEAEQELDFSEDFQAEHEGGHIYESIEQEIEGVVDEAAEEVLPDDPHQDIKDFEEAEFIADLDAWLATV